MLGNKSIVCVIPARMQSSRFPRKLLAPLGGKPLIQWAFEGAMKVSFFDKVVVAVDDPELYEVVTGFGIFPLFLRYFFDQEVEEIDIAPLGFAPNIVVFSPFPFLQDKPNPFSMIFNKEPIPHIDSLAIYRKWLFG